MFAAILDLRYLQLKFLSKNQRSQIFKNLKQKARELRKRIKNQMLFLQPVLALQVDQDI